MSVLGFQISAYDGEERLKTLDPLYASVEDAIAHENEAVEAVALAAARAFPDALPPANLRLRVEAVTAVVWL